MNPIAKMALALYPFMAAALIPTRPVAKKKEKTAFDHERLARAEAKRERRRQRNMEQSR